MPDRTHTPLWGSAVGSHRFARRELQSVIRRVAILVLLLNVLLVWGMVAYALIEHTSIAYGFVWTLDTLTTLGSIPTPGDAGGRVLQVSLELFGIGTLFYAFATIAEFFVSGQLSGLLEERRMQKMIDSERDHYIVCGFGRVGRQVARDLRAAGRRVVVVDTNPENREIAREHDFDYIEDAPSDDEVLRRAGIERARAVVACVDSDAENIFIALTARELRADIMIIARASAEDSEKKLLRAGANRVISPYKTSGSEMARIALHPQVAAAIEMADFRMEEVEVSADCTGAGKTVEDVRGQAVIVAVRRAGGGLEAQPAPDTVLRPGDMVVAIGSPLALEHLEEAFQPAGARA